MRSAILLLLLPLLVALSSALTPASFFSSSDQARLQAAFASALSSSSSDLSSLHGAANGLRLLGKAPSDAADACKRLQGAIKDGADLRELFLAADAGQALGCKLKANAEVTQVKIVGILLLDFM